MTSLLAPALLALLASAPVQQQEPIAVIWGQVRSEQTGAPLVAASITIVGADSRFSVETDENGIYILARVPPGRRLVRATHLDHAPLEVEVLVAVGQRVSVDFDLSFRPLRLPTVHAEASRALGTVTADTTPLLASDLGQLQTRILEGGSPGVAEMGLADVAREVPGVGPIDPSDVLYVRGGAADLKLVLLNGAPVYQPFHIGGLVNALEPDLLHAATLYNGGAPARYDGGLSYIMDMETRTGRRTAPRGSFSMDMLAARTTAEGPITDRVVLLTAARYVHGRGARQFLAEPFPYAYGDALGRIDIDLGGTRTLMATGFWNHESVSLDSIGAIDQQARWGNRAGSLRYSGPLGQFDARLTLATGRFHTELPLSGLRPLLTRGDSDRLRAAIDLERGLRAGGMMFGISFDRIQFDNFALPYGATRDSAIFSSSGRGSVAGVYSDIVVRPLERVRVRAGLRADVFSVDPRIRLAPRLSVSVALTERAELTLAGGRYRQYVRKPERSSVFLGAQPDPVGRQPALEVAGSSHFVLAMTQQLAEGLRLGLEGFYKTFDGLQSGENEYAEASGVDLWVQRNAGSVRGWLSYSLAWVWSADDEASGPTHLFAGRHLVSTGLAGPLPEGGLFDVRVSYGAGLPYTAIPKPEADGLALSVAAAQTPGDVATTPEVADLPSATQEPYLRIDAQASRRFNTSVGDFQFALTPYIKLINALNRRDAMFYQYNHDTDRVEPLAGLPILPVLGMTWNF